MPGFRVSNNALRLDGVVLESSQWARDVLLPGIESSVE